MKKALGILLAGLLALGLTACAGTKTDAPATEAGISLLNEGVLTIGMEMSYPPFEMLAEDGVTPIGFDVDFGAALAEKLGLEVQYINTGWDTIFGGIGINYDVVISAVAIDSERQQTMLFSTPYLDNYQAVVLKKGSTLTIGSFMDLDGCSVALQKETTSDALISDYIATGTINATVVANESVMTCFTQLTNGEVDAVLCDSTVADSYLASSPELYTLAYKNTSEPETFGVAIGKGNTALQAAINEALAELQAENFIQENTYKWFGQQ